MKNLKVIISLLPVLILGMFIYFSTIGFSKLNDGSAVSAKNKKEKIEIKKTSSTIMLWINLTSVSGSDCLTGSYQYCINRGTPIQVFGEGFSVEVPCNEQFTICVSSGTCAGAFTGSVACDTETFISIQLSPLVSCVCN
ncbi:MAG: hypothetical protein K1X86_12120 [Ignavibacteria bacterium]|nr:hypothetical protein [Ignavibacteria bacterium]